MTTFIVRRILISIPVFLGITLLVFTFIALAPGSIADALIRPELGTNPEARALIIARYGLDQPIPIRYVLLAGECPPGRSRLPGDERELGCHRGLARPDGLRSS